METRWLTEERPGETLLEAIVKTYKVSQSSAATAQTSKDNEEIVALAPTIAPTSMHL